MLSLPAFILLVASISGNASDSQSLSTLRHEAKTQNNRGEWHLAQKTFRRAIQLAATPAEKVDLEVDLIFLLLRLEDQAAARAILDAIEAQQPQLPHSLVQYRALASIGVAYWQLGEARRALGPVAEAVRGLAEFLPPDELDAYRLALANINLDLRDHLKASESLAAIETPAARGCSNYHYVFAMVSLARRDYSIAEERFQLSLSAPDFALLTPAEKATIYLGYFSVLAKLKRKAEVKATQRKIKELQEEALTLSGAHHKVAWQSLR